MVAYFFVITAFPLYPPHDSCHVYLRYRHEDVEGYHRFIHYGHGLYTNIVICLAGWVS